MRSPRLFLFAGLIAAPAAVLAFLSWTSLQLEESERREELRIRAQSTLKTKRRSLG